MSLPVTPIIRVCRKRSADPHSAVVLQLKKYKLIDFRSADSQETAPTQNFYFRLMSADKILFYKEYIGRLYVYCSLYYVYKEIQVNKKTKGKLLKERF
uniref:FERM domain-containing protein n=1 Tax=Heterorhabditis bacteriophora TaxID=37862 RepID=A0A1I7X9A2_HETBA